jgi:hypothetical protein
MSSSGRFVRFRWSISLVLLILSFICSYAGKTDNVLAWMIPSDRVAAAMYFLLFPVFAVLAIGFSVVNLGRYRSLQFLLEVAAAFWLLARAVLSLLGPT